MSIFLFFGSCDNSECNKDGFDTLTAEVDFACAETVFVVIVVETDSLLVDDCWEVGIPLVVGICFPLLIPKCKQHLSFMEELPCGS